MTTVTAPLPTATTRKRRSLASWTSDQLDLIVTPVLALILLILLVVVWTYSTFDLTTDSRVSSIQLLCTRTQ